MTYFIFSCNPKENPAMYYFNSMVTSIDAVKRIVEGIEETEHREYVIVKGVQVKLEWERRVRFTEEM